MLIIYVYILWGFQRFLVGVTNVVANLKNAVQAIKILLALLKHKLIEIKCKIYLVLKPLNICTYICMPLL